MVEIKFKKKIEYNLNTCKYFRLKIYYTKKKIRNKARISFKINTSTYSQKYYSNV